MLTSILRLLLAVFRFLWAVLRLLLCDLIVFGSTRGKI